MPRYFVTLLPGNPFPHDSDEVIETDNLQEAVIDFLNRHPDATSVGGELVPD